MITTTDDVRMTFDREAFVLGQVARPSDQHWRSVPDGPWIRMVREALRLPELCLHYHQGTRQYVLGGWVIPKRGFVECVTYPYNPNVAPGLCHRSSLPWLRWRFRPSKQAAMEAIRHRDERNKKALAERREDLQQRTELVRSLKLKGLHATADSVENDGQWIGNNQGGDGLRELKEDAANRLRGRVFYT